MSEKKIKEKNWRRWLSIFVLFAVLAYAFGEPYLEDWLGIDLPSIRENQTDVATAESQSEDSDQRPAGPINSQVSAAQQSETAILDLPVSNSSGNNREMTKSAEAGLTVNSFLTPTGKKNRLRSPAGLIYGETKGEHRLDHVMRHAEDDRNRPIHSVFVGTRIEILQLIDEAFGLIQSGSSRVKTKPDERLHFRVEHTVDMQRKIGYLGGKKGRRENYPPRSKLTLILDNGKFMVTAYPDR